MPEEEELIYTIPLGTYKPRTKRAESAIRDIKKYISRRLKSENVWVDPKLNELVWSRAIKHAPKKLRVKAVKFEDGLVEVSLPEVEKEEKAEEEKEEKGEEELEEEKEEEEKTQGKEARRKIT